MTTLTPDPIDNNTQRVLVRNTATGFEQSIAVMAGFFTAGPLGSLASWGAIRGLQGKWAPWFILGVPASFVINVVQFVIIFSMMDTSELEYNPPVEEPPRQENILRTY